MAPANLFDLTDSLNDLGGCILVIKLGSGNRPTRQDAAVIRSADNNADVLLFTKRQKLLESRVINKSIAASQQETVEVCLPREARQHFGLVHACANRLHRTLATKLMERWVGAEQRFLIVVIGIVNEQNV